MLRIGVVGLGKMGLSHLSMIKAHPKVEIAGICDTSKYVLDVLTKYTGMHTFTDYPEMLKKARPDAVIVATPSRFHGVMVRSALEQDVHVFCEKPFSLDAAESDALARLAEDKKLVNQVGYHYRFVAAFQEAKRLLDLRAIGKVSHVLAEAYGPVVLRPQGMSWRTQKDEGGGCLYDYAAHPVNLLNWYFGMVESASGTVMNTIFSRQTEDEVYGTLRFANGPSVQLSVNWSDESYRKMSVKLSFWGTEGRIVVDRQECQAYLRDGAGVPPGYGPGWNVRYTTDLTQPVWFYVRGEEYSAQLDHFVDCIEQRATENMNSFASGALTDKTLALMLGDAQGARPPAPAKSSFFSRN